MRSLREARFNALSFKVAVDFGNGQEDRAGSFPLAQKKPGRDREGYLRFC